MVLNNTGGGGGMLLSAVCCAATPMGAWDGVFDASDETAWGKPTPLFSLPNPSFLCVRSIGVVLQLRERPRVQARHGGPSSQGADPGSAVRGEEPAAEPRRVAGAMLWNLGGVQEPWRT